MGVYALTGGASGIGACLSRELQDNGHTVISVDMRDADIIADLSTPAGRRAAGVLEGQPGLGIDGGQVFEAPAILAALGVVAFDPDHIGDHAGAAGDGAGSERACAGSRRHGGVRFGGWSGRL